jgi:hypothetical protein
MSHVDTGIIGDLYEHVISTESRTPRRGTCLEMLHRFFLLEHPSPVVLGPLDAV